MPSELPWAGGLAGARGKLAGRRTRNQGEWGSVGSARRTRRGEFPPRKNEKPRDINGGRAPPPILNRSTAKEIGLGGGPHPAKQPPVTCLNCLHCLRISDFLLFCFRRCGKCQGFI